MNYESLPWGNSTAEPVVFDPNLSVSESIGRMGHRIDMVSVAYPETGEYSGFVRALDGDDNGDWRYLREQPEPVEVRHSTIGAVLICLAAATATAAVLLIANNITAGFAAVLMGEL